MNKPQLSAKLEKKLRSIIQKNTQSDGQGYGFSGEEEVIALFATALEERTTLCRKVYVHGCDWAEWNISDEKAGKYFDDELKELLNGDKV